MNETLICVTQNNWKKKATFSTKWQYCLWFTLWLVFLSLIWTLPRSHSCGHYKDEGGAGSRPKWDLSFIESSGIFQIFFFVRGVHFMWAIWIFQIQAYSNKEVTLLAWIKPKFPCVQAPLHEGIHNILRLGSA
jgi:hypothetical protein